MSFDESCHILLALCSRVPKSVGLELARIVMQKRCSTLVNNVLLQLTVHYGVLCKTAGWPSCLASSRQ